MTPAPETKSDKDIKNEKDKSSDKDKADKKKPNIGSLEEDDEFEEFRTQDWTKKDEDEKDLNVWEDNWDDDNVEDDFSVQLRAELEKQNLKPSF